MKKSEMVLLKKKKKVYTAIACVFAAVQTALLCLGPDGVLVKALYSGKNYYYVSQSVSAVIVFCVLIVFHLILLVIFYEKKLREIKCKLYGKKVRNSSGKCKNITSAVLISVITISTLIFSFSNVNYIDKNGYYDGEAYHEFSEIEKISLDVTSYLSAVGKYAKTRRYVITCNVSFGTSEAQLSSIDFYSYKDLYEFLQRTDRNIVNINKSGFDVLLKYEEESLRLLSSGQTEENVRFIELIRDY